MHADLNQEITSEAAVSQGREKNATDDMLLSAASCVFPFVLFLFSRFSPFFQQAPPIILNTSQTTFPILETAEVDS